MMMLFWKRAGIAAAIVGLAGILAIGRPASTEAAIAKMPRGSIYLLRGLANVFSLGLDDLNDQLHARGVGNSIVTNYSEWQSIAAEIEAQYRTDKAHALPVILMGHSFGADSTLLLAAELAKHAIPVALIVNFDAVTQISVPANVVHIVNFYESHDNGLALHAARGFHGRLDNIDVVKFDPTIGHLNIEKSQRLHARAIADVLAVLGR
jgi:pimeloyl-ACP methyl ester carboxylesterase